MRRDMSDTKIRTSGYADVRTDVTGATLCLYPHRPAQAATRWLDEFMIDLSSHAAALAGHTRIVESERVLGLNPDDDDS